MKKQSSRTVNSMAQGIQFLGCFQTICNNGQILIIFKIFNQILCSRRSIEKNCLASHDLVGGFFADDSFGIRILTLS